jgi:hypothetical protein
MSGTDTNTNFEEGILLQILSKPVQLETVLSNKKTDGIFHEVPY